MRIPFLLSLVLPAALGCARQIPPAAESTAPETQKKERLCRIAGRTVHAQTGEPVRKVKLLLRRMGVDSSAYSAVSDSEGRFVIDDIEPGTYYLLAERAGYLRQAYGSRGFGYGRTVLTLTAGQELKDLEFKVMPQGVITGKLLDEEGEPVREASINVFRQVRAGSSARLAGVRGESTNDVGEYRVAELAPGIDQNGWFSIKGVVPGEYKLYASNESLGGANEDPEALKPFEEKAVKVTVAEKGRERVEIELLNPRDAQTP
jgi:carboxypeptidase family protein